MSIRPDKPKEYFVRLLDIPEEKIDYNAIPPTTRADWQDAEVLLPVSVEEFQAIKEFLRNRRRRKADTADHLK